MGTRFRQDPCPRAQWSFILEEDLQRIMDTEEDEEAAAARREACCKYWNIGLDCRYFYRGSGRCCRKLHICSADFCDDASRNHHRAVQHPPEPLCNGHTKQLLGMNRLYLEPLRFHPDSSVEDTNEACRIYEVKEPSLNAVLFEELLQETDIEAKLQASLVRGWKEGLDLGSDLPEEDHLVGSPTLNLEKLTILEASLEKEKRKRRLKGPFKNPIRDDRWFKQAWVSPYFVIPKNKLPGVEKKWRLIHHLSFHKSGCRKQSLNGHINLAEFPTCFPTHLTGAHLIF